MSLCLLKAEKWRAVCTYHPRHSPSCVFQALMSLFVLASKDGWVNIMYNGLDAVAVDQQVGGGLGPGQRAVGEGHGVSEAQLSKTGISGTYSPVSPPVSHGPSLAILA